MTPENPNPPSKETTTTTENPDGSKVTTHETDTPGTPAEHSKETTTEPPKKEEPAK